MAEKSGVDGTEGREDFRSRKGRAAEAAPQQLGDELQQLNGRLKILEEETETMKKALSAIMDENKELIGEISLLLHTVFNPSPTLQNCDCFLGRLILGFHQENGKQYQSSS
ncbi:hypothetical protein Nepgr_005457 [Nepenthes gracilis]|uniref:Uncharacterized protein n=1 Tax=Nepenthes gracilis TaxID=150966 RepID=A0AAD3S370_NEPGR|nr:hypothetical protein Nepgr_005457 [Nepenthes gracilis]